MSSDEIKKALKDSGLRFTMLQEHDEPVTPEPVKPCDENGCLFTGCYTGNCMFGCYSGCNIASCSVDCAIGCSGVCLTFIERNLEA